MGGGLTTMSIGSWQDRRQLYRMTCCPDDFKAANEAGCAMRILISNDDGILAPGIQSLIRVMATLGQVTVVAPDRQRSASSHGITLNCPLYATQVELDLPAVDAWSLTGTPVDCVKWAITQLGRSHPFDVMVSGINEGSNLAVDVLYSGTVAAAGEAALQHVPAIAFSLSGPAFPFPEAASVAKEIASRVVRHGLPADTFLNVNFPPNYILSADWMTTPLGVRSYRDEFVLERAEDGRQFYTYAGEAIEESGPPMTDVHAVEAGHISITPLIYRFTNTAMIDSLRSWLIR